ncbi:Arginine N-methyltransferase 2 [Tulasnella sp. 331]|nr:Arginine N-methyltransferase 2 [Tulasnella sp. 331]KAG8883524.1 Arginine N-methyltransferase 2 [Tulasnella sp. 332]
MHDPEIEDEAELYIEAGIRLLDAVESADLVAVKRLVEQEEPPMFFQDPESGWSALHLAAAAESSELLEYLLERGAVWNLGQWWLEASRYDSPPMQRVQQSIPWVCAKYKAEKKVQSSEFILRALGGSADPPSAIRTDDETAAASLDTFLKSRLTFTTDAKGQDLCMVRAGDDAEVGVMMGWERPIMVETVKRICDAPPETHGPRVLNVGFGLGIIDTLFQASSAPPSLHVIIEAHPDVLAHMRKTGWYEKENVMILEGKWQDHISSDLLLSLGGFDAIYTDTFSEEYADLYAFFEHVPNLLRGPSAYFSWFNGLGATNALFYDIYARLAELHLNDMGLSVSWSEVDVSEVEDDTIWSGSRKYFTLPFYRLPICAMVSPAQG